MSDLKAYLKDQQVLVDDALNQFLPRVTVRPKTVHQGMRYSIFAGGKRLRPILTLAAAEACGGEMKNALPPACSVEIMHTYSLVHDDLPCMDDDDLRRGRPTSHKVYGEGMAVLIGDALLTEAFTILAETPPTKRYDLKDILLEFSICGGSRKLIGGQVLDLEGEGKELSKAQLVRIHENKTAALLTTSLRLGGMTANANSTPSPPSATISDWPSRSSTTFSMSPNRPHNLAKPQAKMKPSRRPPTRPSLDSTNRKTKPPVSPAKRSKLSPSSGEKASAWKKSPTIS